MIIAIRISGLVEVPPTEKATLYHIRLRKKYSAILLADTPKNDRLLKSVRNFIAYGKIDNETLVELLAKRGKSLSSKKFDAAKVALEVDKKSLEELGLKPFFRLHPPRGGIDSKVHFPIRNGVLGDNKEKINELVRRML